jgi:protein arginine N-methyltransferase 7
MAPKKAPPKAQKPPGHVDAASAKLPPPPPSNAAKGIGFVPPGADKRSKQSRNAFEFQFDEHFRVPSRIAKAPTPLIEAVNDFHFAMMNDVPRNQFYLDLLKRHVTPETGVLEIGAGSGLLSMMAAQLGAKWVVAVEGSAEMSRLAQSNVAANNFSDKIRVLHKMSTDLALKDLPGRPDILVSEIFGTLLLGESALDYIADIRERILKPSTVILPQFGTQYAVLVECPLLDSICSVSTWNGLDLSHVTALKDTASVVFTKKYGFRFSTLPYKELCDPIPVIDIDFKKTKPGFMPMETFFKITATKSGTAHAMLLFWKATDGKDLVMSTDPRDTQDNFPRDMQWGQALQLLDDAGVDGPLPVPVVLEEGNEYRVGCCTSDDHVLLQFAIATAKAPAAAAAASEQTTPAVDAKTNTTV